MLIRAVDSLHPLTLPSEHAAALRQSEVRATWGMHGFSAEYVEGWQHGSAIFYVRDREYAEIAKFVADLDPVATILTGEATRHTGYGQQWSVEAYQQELRGHLEASPRVRALYDNIPNELPDMLAAGRQAKVITPLEYGQGLFLQAVDTIDGEPDTAYRHTDVTFEQIRAWAGDMEQLLDLQRRPYMQSLLHLISPEVQNRFRDRRIVEGMGAAAFALSERLRGSNETPVVAYMGGYGHRKNIERILDANGVPYTSELFTPDWRRIVVAEKARQFGARILRGHIKSPTEVAGDRWLAVDP